MTERDPNLPAGGPPLGSASGQTPPSNVWRPPVPEASDTPTQTDLPASGGPVAGSPEPSAETARATAVAAAPPSRAGAVRWGIALVIVALVIGVTAAVTFMLTGQTAPSTLLGYAHPDAVVYAEVRLDLPGDQRAKLGEFLSKFPGFDDQTTLDAKLDEVLDRLIGESTNGQHNFSSEIKPWFDGQLGLSMGRLPELAAGNPRPSFLALVTVKDPAAATAWLDEITAGLDSASGDYNGTELTTIQGDFTSAYAVADSKVLLLGDEESVKAAIDSKGTGGLAKADRFAKARRTVEGDHVGFFYVDLRAYMDWAVDAMGQVGSPAPFPPALLDSVPEWVAASMRMENDALRFDTASPHTSLNPVSENRIGQIAEHVPSDTIVLLDAHDYGKTIKALVDGYRQEPSLADAFRQFDLAAGFLGGFDAIVNWIGDAGVALAPTGTGLHGGIVVRPTDRAAAERFLTTVRSSLQAFGGQAGIAVREETHGGVTVTVVDFGDASQLSGAMRIPVQPGQRIEMAWAVTDDVVVFGVGPSFVRAVLDAGPGPSLAEDERYRALVDRVGAENATAAFVDIAAIRQRVEVYAALTGVDMSFYEENVKPYLEPLDAIIQATVVGDVDQVHGQLTVK